MPPTNVHAQRYGIPYMETYAFAMDSPKPAGTMRALLNGYPSLKAELNDLVGPVHVFADAASRDAACHRFNPGVFEFRPVSAEHAKYVCRKLSGTVRFAIGPALHCATFLQVAETVFPVQARFHSPIGETSHFVLEIDQVEYRVVLEKPRRVEIIIDNRLGRRSEMEISNTRVWLAKMLPAFF